jgi:hypothetical protein
VLTARTRRLVFWFEKDLEDYLEVNLSLLEQNLLVIGRQIKIGIRRRIDLLAIDSTGVIYIIELKLNKASPAIIAQVLDYRHSIKRLNREEIIRVIASGDLGIDLEDAFQRHFGHPLPETVNHSQELMIIAASIHPRTARSVLELKDAGYSITTFRYVVQHDAVGLIPCSRDHDDLEAAHTATTPLARLKRPTAAISFRSPTYRVRVDLHIRWFWLTQAQFLPSPLASFELVYERYELWVLAQSDEGLQLELRTPGQFGRQLAAITAESEEWSRVFVAPGSNMDARETSMDAPSVRTRRDFHHRIVAYQRNTVDNHNDESPGHRYIQHVNNDSYESNEKSKRPTPIPG